ncbi:MAG TPA: hypothetical protein VF011_09725 [Terriglobales bacterium]
MPDAKRIENQLYELLSSPRYGSLLDHRNRFEHPARRVTPQSLAQRTAQSLVANRCLLDPVYVEEIRGEAQFYRGYDGVSSEQGTAMTLGSSWSSRKVVERIWGATPESLGAARKERFMDFMRSANFIHPSWNQMRDIACMRVPAGAWVVVVRGRGNWRAMQTNRPGAAKPLYPKPYHPFNNPQIESIDDVLYSLEMMPTPGEEQYNIPLFNDLWVCKVAQQNPSWPLACA